MALGLAGTVSASANTFEEARVPLETRCLECHHPEKAKGGLLLTTREQMLAGGDTGPGINIGDPESSLLLGRILLDADHDDLMPPRGGPLAAGEIEAIRAWISEGAPWPNGVTLAPRADTALPGWNAPPDPDIASIEAFPKMVTLETAADFHRVVVIAHMKDAATHDVTRQVRARLADPAIASLTDTRLDPLADGTTTLELEYRGLTTSVPVVVKNAAQPRPVSFQLDVMPVLTSATCNTGSCHGSARGQDGFHLTLYGYDPEGDHFRLTREMAGRRVNLGLPEESLLLTKAIGAVPHTGGKLFDENSPEYQTLLQWIRDGAGYDEGEIPHPTGIEVEPPQLVLKGGDLEMPMTVRATYSDGTDRDVTALSSFSTSNDHAVEIDPRTGTARSKNRGEAFLLARFHTFTEGSQAIVIPREVEYTRPSLPEFNGIDHHVHEKLHRLRLIPSELSTDETFVRRVYIDIIGRVPSVEERAAFLSNKSADKRAELVEALIARPEFAEMWVMKWAELLQIRTINNGPNQVSYKAALGYHGWLRERIASNTPFNEIARELLASEGGTFDNPPTNFFQIEQDVLKLTENVAQVFMGTRIQCAQCHNHPFDRWTMDDYYGFASFFARVKRKRAEDPRERVVFEGGGEIRHPVSGENVAPRFLGSTAPAELGRETRRKAVADWLASPDNPWFARNVVNIVWAHFFGVGITDPVDDVRISNPPSNPALLDALARNFTASNYDIRSIVREICNSRTYQLSSRTNATNAGDERNFSRSLIRRMRAEVLLDTISHVTATPNKFKGLPLGSSAVEIADGNTSTYFLTTFGRAKRATVCSCEVRMEPNLSQALHLLNGDATHRRIKQSPVVRTRLDAGQEPMEIVRHLYLRALGRDPTARESEALAEHLNEAKGSPARTREILDDIFWALLNSKEFLFNH
ncbi:PSD1 and planctomycete cytochrome C domain-containing protein [Haloferula sp. A504]|uniref:PSD1 and planctomycete cytochrome C domain-containing protein n=1 Tax=Haloferula sp. A504 TaxID=3373601 RepID=UPI0031C6A2C5|nr:PSD1 and planctomycete cytochrome C domain-containing protein [Verrucomicrobiaceae bacterium E54]